MSLATGHRLGRRLHIITTVAAIACVLCEVPVQDLELLLEWWLCDRMRFIVHEVLLEHLRDEHAQALDLARFRLQKLLQVLILGMSIVKLFLHLFDFVGFFLD